MNIREVNAFALTEMTDSWKLIYYVITYNLFIFSHISLKSRPQHEWEAFKFAPFYSHSSSTS
jgi:hypothetical protein